MAVTFDKKKHRWGDSWVLKTTPSRYHLMKKPRAVFINIHVMFESKPSAYIQMHLIPPLGSHDLERLQKKNNSSQ